jgi:sodium-dependent dicarboxylate transporter 2/3/5
MSAVLPLFSPSRLSEAEPLYHLDGPESGFDLWRQRCGLLLAPIAFALLWFLSSSLPPAANHLSAVLGAVVVLWVTEAIPMVVTAFVGVSAAVALHVAPASEAFASFADPLIFVFIGVFMLARSMLVHGLDRRLAFAILGMPSVGARPGRVLAAFSAVTCVASMLIDSTATTAMMFPIGISLLAAIDSQGNKNGCTPAFGTMLLLSAAFAGSVGGLATPVGTAPNLIGIGFIRRELGVSLPFFSWMALGMPIVALLFVWLVIQLWHGGVKHVTAMRGFDRLVATERAALGPWTRGQINTLVATGVTVALWLLPGFVALVAGRDHWIHRAIAETVPESVAAMTGTTLLFVLPTDFRSHRFTLPWSEAAKIDWWIIFLYGGGIALGTLTLKTGLAAVVGRALTGYLGVSSGFALLALSTVIATVLSETTSNTAAANMVIPVVIACSRSAGIDPVLPTIGATMGASLGFMLPVSNPSNAIVYGSGRVPLVAMMRHGLTLDVVGVAVIVVVLRLLGPIVLGPSVVGR